MAVNGGDIVSGVRLAFQIYDLGFNEENAADVRYKNFRNDIFNFRYLLEKLEEALKAAQQRYQAKARLARIGAYDPLSEDFEKERKTIVGNFIETLNACDKLLAENKQYRLKYSNVIENLRWHLSQQERRVDELRTRLHFHSEKIRLVMDRLSINLLTDLDAKVDDLLALSEQNLQVSHEIYRELVLFRSTLFGHLSGRAVSLSPESEMSHRVGESTSLRFQRYLLIDTPKSTGLGIPMSQGFDALFLSFEQSANSSDCTPESYLSFLKARWLLAHLEASEEYCAARPGFYYKRAVNQISQAINIRMRQPGALISYDESVLMDLPDSHFRIWPQSDPVPAVQQSEPHPLMIRANEEEVVRLTLAPVGTNEGDIVTLFKSSEERFRIVRQATIPSRPDEKVLIPQQVYIREDKLIPRYALPMIDDPDMDIAIIARNEETYYHFDTYESLFRFQTALTGYDVSHDQQGILCQLSDNVGFPACKARVQLWQEPIVFNSAQAVRGAQHTLSGLSSFSDGSRSRFDSLAETVGPSNTIRRAPEGWEAENVKLPAVVIFTRFTDAKKGERFAILFMELRPEIYVDPKECSCCRDYNSCSNLVLTNTEKKKGGISVRALFSEAGYAGQTGFDLLPFRIPHHPGSSKLMPFQTDYLVLKFGSLADKRRFDKELQHRFKVRDKQIQNQRDFAEQIRRLDTQRPLRHTSTHGHQRSMSDTPSVVSLAPHIDLPSTDSRLDTSFIRGIGSSAESVSSRSTSLYASPRQDSTRNTTPDPEKETVDILRTSPLRPVPSQSQPKPATAPQPLVQATRTTSSHAQRSEQRYTGPSATSAQAGNSTLQADLPTLRNKQGKRKGFWQTFRP